MVPFTRHTLSNGLRVIVHEDRTTPLAAVNVLYYVGSRDEQPDKTGFAHLFEHLMFAGSKNAPDFDGPLQHAGGENNAYTTNDYTTFYEILARKRPHVGAQYFKKVAQRAAQGGGRGI
jgi:zinc protease